MSSPVKEEDPFLEGGGGFLKPRAGTTFFLVLIISLVLTAILFLIPYFICLEMIFLCFSATGLGMIMADTYIRDRDDVESNSEFYGHDGYLAIKVLFWSNLSVLMLILVSNIFSGIFYHDGYALQMLIWVGIDVIAIPLLSGAASLLFRRRCAPKQTIATVAFVYMAMKILVESILGIIAVLFPVCIGTGPLRKGEFVCPTPPPGVRSPGSDILAVGIVFRVLYCGVLMLSCSMLRKYLPLKNYSGNLGCLFFISACLALILSLMPIVLFFGFSRDQTICPIFGQVGSTFYNWLFSRSSLPTVPFSEYYSSSPVKSLTFLPL